MEDQLTVIRKLLDVLAVEVAGGRTDTAELRAELRNETAGLRAGMRSGFGRVERRLGNLENRVEGVETELRSFREEFAQHKSSLGH